ncbi:MAG TPA: sigma-54 dependent transcriptional regulator [Steroidobacteraceae bacterium]|nr:sigma-54 dependent transcriptional regulator [Steroidobacteraceae bacterium]
MAEFPDDCILIVDDQADVREALRLLLKSEKLDSCLASNPAEALEAAGRRPFAAALIDMNYLRGTASGEEGLKLLAALRRIDADLPVIVMTAWGSIDLAVAAMRGGAQDFIEKPWDNTRLVSVLRNQLRLGGLRRREQRLEAENRLLHDPPAVLVAESTPMRRVLDVLDRVAASSSSVLILGENGTGKGLLARRLHERSPREAHSFVQVNMGALSEAVLESELFGHVRGAFTDAKSDRIGRIELADGGTLFLDEIANLPLSQQPKLLRVLEQGEFERVGSSRTQRADLRVVSATNADLHEAARQGRFRTDLLFRLNTVELRVPALRERPEDIVPLARLFLERSAARFGREAITLSGAAERALTAYPWPGNVRELDHALERAVLLSTHSCLEAGELGLGSNGPIGEAVGSELRTLAAAEQALIREALARHHGNILKAAEELGVSRAALYRRLQKFGWSEPT